MLVSAIETSEGVVPVLMEVREFTDEATGNVLYLTVSMHEINEADIVAHTHIFSKENTPYAPSASNFKIADILRNVNTDDLELLQYIPDGFLDKEHLVAKKRRYRKLKNI